MWLTLCLCLQFISQAAERIASSGVSPSYEPPVAQFSAPTVFSVDTSNLRRDHKAGGSPNNPHAALALPPAHEQYGYDHVPHVVGGCLGA